MAEANLPTADDQSPEQIRNLYPEFRRAMIKRKNEIISRSGVMQNNLDEQIMDSPGDDADVSVVDTSADYFLKLANNLQDELLEIGDAFDRMRMGVYGVCENCSDAINVERLRRVPAARLCITCQSEAERHTGPMRHKQI